MKSGWIIKLAVFGAKIEIRVYLNEQFRNAGFPGGVACIWDNIKSEFREHFLESMGRGRLYKVTIRNVRLA